MLLPDNPADALDEPIYVSMSLVFFQVGLSCTTEDHLTKLRRNLFRLSPCNDVREADPT
jgi:hypothetical protein